MGCQGCSYKGKNNLLMKISFGLWIIITANIYITFMVLQIITA